MGLVMDVLHRVGNVLIIEKVSNNCIRCHVVSNDLSSLAFSGINRLDVTNQS
jgi:hypothetical protein